MIAQAPMAEPQQPLGYSQDPRSAMLAQALQSMHSSTQQQGNVGGLTSNLLAEALMQSAYQQQRQNAQGVPGAQGGVPTANAISVDPNAIDNIDPSSINLNSAPMQGMAQQKPGGGWANGGGFGSGWMSRLGSMFGGG